MKSKRLFVLIVPFLSLLLLALGPTVAGPAVAGDGRPVSVDNNSISLFGSQIDASWTPDAYSLAAPDITNKVAYTITNLGHLGGNYSIAIDFNDAGQVVGGALTSEYNASCPNRYRGDDGGKLHVSVVIGKEEQLAYPRACPMPIAPHKYKKYSIRGARCHVAGFFVWQEMRSGERSGA